MTHAETHQDDQIPGEYGQDGIPGEYGQDAGEYGQDAQDVTGEPAGGGLTTEQIARAGEPVARTEPAGTADTADTDPAGQAHEGTHARAAQQPHAQLLKPDELQSIVDRWKEIQAGFVDEPRKAVKEADALVADLMQRLAQMFASEREQLESRWTAGDSVSTEDLRQGFQRYRSFFERLLAA
jgi:hypothetical protein